MKRILSIILLIGLLQACNKDNKFESSNQNSFSQLERYASTPDHSSPENLITSLWQYKIWSDTVFFYDTSLEVSKYYSDDYYKKLQDVMRKRIDEFKKNGHYIEQNRIIKTANISDSISIVYTEEYQYPDDKSFDQLKYDFIKTKNGWSINDCSKKCVICEGIGKDFSNKDKKCINCEGSGWIEAYPY